MQEQITVGSLLREYGGNYISQNWLPEEQRSLIHLLSACSTASLGSHFEKCDHCSYMGKANNSCRNRHCPRCQQNKKMIYGLLFKAVSQTLPELTRDVKHLGVDIGLVTVLHIPQCGTGSGDRT